MKRFVLFFAGIFSILALNACNNIDTEEDGGTGGAYICIEAGAERTICPSTFTLEGMSHFNFYGKKTETDKEDTLTGGMTYEQLLEAKIAISAGTWYELKLTACKNYSTYFVGTISNREILQGKNTLHFTLSLDEENSSSSGNVNVTFKIPSATAVKAAKAGLYTLDTDELYDGTNSLSITPLEESDTATAMFHDNIKVGTCTYRLNAWFYADEECTMLVSTFSELVKIVGGSTSEAERDIKLNEVYTITLTDAGEYKDSYTPKTVYTRYEGVELPSTDQMKNKPGYTFMGWYTSADGTGDPVTEISGTQAENVVLYAKWYEGCAVTAQNYMNASFASSEYGDTYTILLLGEWTDEALSGFCSRFRSASISSTRAVTLDMSEITGVTAIPYEAFFDSSLSYSSPRCTSLVAVLLPEGITSIGDSAFRNCTSLKKITIPESVTSIGSSAFYGCSSLTEIAIPENVTCIGSSAFFGCSSLREMDIPETVTSIESRAFYDCTSLAKISIPNTVTSIGSEAFFGCSSLAEIAIPNTVTSIGNRAFHGCSALTEIALPETVTSIESDAFYGCTSLAEIAIPNTVTSIGNGAFRGCSSLSKITIPENVTSIDGWAFAYCNSLTEITIPENVTSIGDYAFCGCSALSKITIPANVTSIGHYAFYGCSSLTTITIPESVNWIGSRAFKNSGLTWALFEGEDSVWDCKLDYSDDVETVKIRGCYLSTYIATCLKTTYTEYDFYKKE
ncbi:MAG: leucine-rich repeat protein [Treponema sp.]|nr:leucine-rich repeat protein [Treponema sp.]